MEYKDLNLISANSGGMEYKITIEKMTSRLEKDFPGISESDKKKIIREAQGHLEFGAIHSDDGFETFYNKFIKQYN